MSDTKKFRQAFKDAGFLPRFSFLPVVYNDKHKGGTRRIKLYDGNGVFASPQFAQEELERQLKKQFGSRYLAGQFIESASRWIVGKSLCIYLLTE